VLVFTGGMGEHSPDLRAAAAEGLRFLGVEVDGSANRATGDADVTADGAIVRTVVVTAAEDVEVARETAQVLAG
jgi:acetate kinase